MEAYSSRELLCIPGKNKSYAIETAYVTEPVSYTHLRRLIQEMERLGAEKKRLTAKIAGGAKMFETGRTEWEIGAQNVASVKKTLAEEGIRLIAEDTGKNYGRTVSFYAGDGRLEVRTVRHETVVL